MSEATVSCPPSVTVFGPSDLRTTPTGLSAASRRTASGLLVITVGTVVSPQRDAVVSCNGLYTGIGAPVGVIDPQHILAGQHTTEAQTGFPGGRNRAQPLSSFQGKRTRLDHDAAQAAPLDRRGQRYSLTSHVGATPRI
ncbi:MAG: hypothetical protein ACRDR6_02070 [Pseudonocardiaceae bacterium]